MITDNKKPQDDDNLGSFYMGRMRPPPEPKRMMPRGMLTVVTILSFVAIIWYAYPEGQEKYSGVDVPVITADKESYKTIPDDPGGMEVRHQDSTVFDPLEKKAEAVEKLMPMPEEPVNKEEAVATKLSLDAPEPTLKLDLKLEEGTDGAEKVVATTESKLDAMKAAAKEEPAKAGKIVEAVKPEVKETPKEKPKAAEKAAETIAKGIYVQLGSYRDLSGAKTDWSKLNKKYPSLLKNLSMKTERVDLGAKGVFHRLQAGKVSEARAKEICAALKAENSGGCVLVKN